MWKYKLVWGTFKHKNNVLTFPSSHVITLLVCNDWMHFDYIKVLHSLFACGFYIGELLKGQTDEVDWILDRKSEVLVCRALFASYFFFPFHVNISLISLLWTSVSLSVNGFSIIYPCHLFCTVPSPPSVFPLFRVQKTLFYKRRKMPHLSW